MTSARWRWTLNFVNIFSFRSFVSAEKIFHSMDFRYLLFIAWSLPANICGLSDANLLNNLFKQFGRSCTTPIARHIISYSIWTAFNRFPCYRCRPTLWVETAWARDGNLCSAFHLNHLDIASSRFVSVERNGIERNGSKLIMMSDRMMCHVWVCAEICVGTQSALARATLIWLICIVFDVVLVSAFSWTVCVQCSLVQFV